ncbi:hypothetical protein NFI96_022470 [Prochilodus magdalenae]|nr:hypothetical protein NFI96_022470 [Prochilodus magdalenae]
MSVEKLRYQREEGSLDCAASPPLDDWVVFKDGVATAVVSKQFSHRNGKSKTHNASFNDPCNNYTSLDQPWRATNATELDICDSYFNWTGWYRLLYNGMNIRVPESCVDEYTCGTDNALWLNGAHPQIKDGIVTRDVCGSTGWACCFYRSTPIRVKACPGNYYVYEFVRPTLLCSAAYCADVNTISPTNVAAVAPNVPSTTTTSSSKNLAFDPCIISTVLDHEWRGIYKYTTSSGHDDTLVEWSGWYLLHHQGQSAQIPESDWCTGYMSCGGYTRLFLGGPHPRLQDGIVTRDIYGTYVSECNFYRSNQIQVKACPGDYYVYRLVKPVLSLPLPTYCAVVFSSLSYNPCNNYTTLDQPWRGTNGTGLRICDRDFNWTGWYRLLYYGMNIRMPESCVDDSSCGTSITLWLKGSHPQIEDGIVTRRVCGRSGSDCCYYRSYPIRVKACPGDYYVYEFVRPVTCSAAYCSGILCEHNLSKRESDLYIQCCSIEYKHYVLDNEWRRTDSLSYTIYRGHDDTLVEWNGWYRLYLQGKSAQLPTSFWCADQMPCSGYTQLFLEGLHPRPQDGIVTRDVYGSFARQCNFYKSIPIQVKACPGDYYVYRLTKPAVSLPMPTYCAAVFSTPSYDPCYNYTPLDRPWRGTNKTGLYNCDRYFNWTGWYRLLYNGLDIRMPESCVNQSRCGTVVSLWLNGSHPERGDGIVTRRVCGKYNGDCCYYRSYPIRVKACPGNYYVYEFVRPTACRVAYCADVTTITSNTTLTISSVPASSINTSRCPKGLLLSWFLVKVLVWSQNTTSDPCLVHSVLNDDWRKLDSLYSPVRSYYDDTLVEWSGWYRLHFEGRSAQIPESVWCSNYICHYLCPHTVQKNFTLACADTLFDQIENSGTPVLPVEIVKKVLEVQNLQIQMMNSDPNITSGTQVLNRTETLVSTLVNHQRDSYSVNISVDGLVEPIVSLKELCQLSINNAQMDIDLIQISKNNNVTASALLEVDPNGALSCVYWSNTEGVIDGCDLLQTNISHTICFCFHLSTFALIMQINPSSDADSDPVIELICTVVVTVGLVFLGLALLTLTICRRNPRVTNTAQINLCISLLLAHLLFLLTQKLIYYIKPHKVVCAVLAGVLHFLFLSAFVWMFIEAVLLFISVKNLTKITSNENAGLWGKWLVVIGYAVPLVVVGMSAALVRGGYGGEKGGMQVSDIVCVCVCGCWLKTEFLWSFLGPVSFILAANTVLFISIMIILISTLTNVKSEMLRIRRSESDQQLFTTVTLKAMVQFIILGCPWILGFFTDHSKMSEIIFILLNSQQGTFIFLVHCVLSPEVSQLSYFKYTLKQHYPMNTSILIIVEDLMTLILVLCFLTASFDDRCNNYTALDQPWRATNATELNICDRDFSWTGWYRLLYYGMNMRMPESCVNRSRCGTDITLWLNGSHPQIEDGIVTRRVCGRSGSNCCYYRSTPIRVKACPGDYYIYEFVKPTTCKAAYCAGTLLVL